MLTSVDRIDIKGLMALRTRVIHAGREFVASTLRLKTQSRAGSGYSAVVHIKRARRGVVLCSVCLLLAGCTAKYTPLYVRNADGRSQAAWRSCHSGGGIDDLSLYAGATTTKNTAPLWEIAAIGTAEVSAITIGDTPPGFQVKVALKEKLLPGTSYTLMANLGSKRSVYGEVTFKPGQLLPGYVVFGKEHKESAGAYGKRSDSSFGCG